LNFTGGATWTCGTVASYWPGGWCDDAFHLTVAPPFRIPNATYPEHFPGCLGLMDGFVSISLELQVPPDSGMYSLDATLWVTAGS
jgi:hypothetical protein